MTRLSPLLVGATCGKEKPLLNIASLLDATVVICALRKADSSTGATPTNTRADMAEPPRGAGARCPTYAWPMADDVADGRCCRQR
eukprot:7215898-Prymnesium_polylepis.2